MIKLTGRIAVNLIRFYWHFILVGLVILWIFLSFLASLVAWRAVFLDNTQVYFGKYFHIPFTRFATLRDVYFLREGAEGEAVSIVPLSTEPHGPKNYMKINVDHLVAVHILRSDSALVKTIEGIEENK